jgi:protein-S-isoprenylcysteine O-methyltransferase Ste14
VGKSAVARLARFRVPLGFVLSALVLWLAHPTRTSLLAGAGIASVGEALRLWAAGHINKSREVTTSGPYRWFAHPLYVGSSIMGLGLGVASHSVAAAAVIATYLAVTIAVAVKAEEAFLRAQFGDAYDRYRAGGVTGRRFSARQAMANREYRALAGLVVILIVLAVKWKMGE